MNVYEGKKPFFGLWNKNENIIVWKQDWRPCIGISFHEKNLDYLQYKKETSSIWIIFIYLNRDNNKKKINICLTCLLLRLGLESSIKKEKKLSWLFASIQIKNKSFFWWVLLGGNIDSGKKAKRQKGKVRVREMRQSKCGSSIRSKEKNKSLKEEKIGSQKKKKSVTFSFFETLFLFSSIILYY